MDFKEMNPLGIVGIVGAVILVVGVFMNWVSFDFGLWGGKSFSGWDYFDLGSDADYYYAPLLCLIVGILSIALMVLPTVMNGEKFEQINNILGVVTLVLSIVAVVMCILWMTQDVMDASGVSKGIGFWLCLVGAIITAVGGIMPILKNKGIINF